MSEQGQVEPMRGWPFAGAAFAFVTVFIAAGSPIALYTAYSESGEVSSAGLTIAFAAYVAVACLSLLFLGRVSDHLGRRPVALGALGLALVGTLLLIGVHDTATLAVGRGLQGLAAGLAATSIGTLLVDSAPSRLRAVASAVTAGGAPFGLAIGATGAGALVQFAAWPRTLSYLVAAALLVLGALAVCRVPETRRSRAGALRSIRPQVAVPPAIRPLLLPSAAIFASTWAVGGFYQASGTSIVREQLRIDDPLVASVAVSALLAASAVAGVVAGRTAIPRPELTGMAIAVVAAVGAAITLVIGTAPGFVIAAVATGVGWGVSYSGALQHLLADTEPSERAGVLAVVYIVSYGGAALPGLVASGFFPSAPLLVVYFAHLAILVVAFAVVVASAVRIRGAQHPNAIRV